MTDFLLRKNPKSPLQEVFIGVRVANVPLKRQSKKVKDQSIIVHTAGKNFDGSEITLRADHKFTE